MCVVKPCGNHLLGVNKHQQTNRMKKRGTRVVKNAKDENEFQMKICRQDFQLVQTETYLIINIFH